MNVQGVATLVHVGLVLTSLSVVAINLNSLGAVALLSVKLASLLMTNVDRLDKEGLVVASSSVRRMSRHASSLLANHRLTGRVEAEVGLSHQLLVEGCVDTSISVEVASLMHMLLSRASISSLTTSASSFEQLREDRFLLLVHVLSTVVDSESFSLDGVVELALTLGSGVLGIITTVLLVISSTCTSGVITR